MVSYPDFLSALRPLHGRRQQVSRHLSRYVEPKTIQSPVSLSKASCYGLGGSSATADKWVQTYWDISDLVTTSHAKMQSEGTIEERERERERYLPGIHVYSTSTSDVDRSGLENVRLTAVGRGDHVLAMGQYSNNFFEYYNLSTDSWHDEIPSRDVDSPLGGRYHANMVIDPVSDLVYQFGGLTNEDYYTEAKDTLVIYDPNGSRNSPQWRELSAANMSCPRVGAASIYIPSWCGFLITGGSQDMFAAVKKSPLELFDPSHLEFFDPVRQVFHSIPEDRFNLPTVACLHTLQLIDGHLLVMITQEGSGFVCDLHQHTIAGLLDSAACHSIPWHPLPPILVEGPMEWYFKSLAVVASL